jgi:hypothetical protein
MGYINSDDMHCPWTLGLVGRVFAEFPEVQWLTTRFPIRYSAGGLATNCYDVRGYAREAFAKGEYMPGTDGFFAAPIQQESTFWRRSLWDKVGGAFSREFNYASDFDLWCRFAKLTDLVAVSAPLAGYRRYGDQKTERAMTTYHGEARRALLQHFSEPPKKQPLRNFYRDRMPAALRPWAEKTGRLHRAKVIYHEAIGDRLSLGEVLV